MFGGVAIPLDSVLPALIAQHDLLIRVYNCCGVDELQFLAHEEPRLLPVLLDGVLRVLPWGNRRGDSAKLPPTLWTSLATIEAGGWGDARIEKVVIPAALAFDSEIWYAASVGVRGLVVPDEKGERHVYVICEPASYAYGIMTKAKWMPCFVGQVLRRDRTIEKNRFKETLASPTPAPPAPTSPLALRGNRSSLVT